MQTILGAGGVIGTETARALTKYTKDIRLVSRNPKKVNETDELLKADLTISEEVLSAVEGSEVVYLTAGFPYNHKVWKATWPKVMHNVIDACKTHKAKLVFFDNIYMYDPDSLSQITEDNPVNPVSKKGKVRAEIAKMLMDEVEKGSITALIARAADFYGPGAGQVSILQETVIKNLAKGKKATWLGNARHIHSYTYTPDAGESTALLGNTKEAFNQVWHLPTSQEKLSGKAFVELIAKELKVEPKIQNSPKGIIKIIGLFSPIMREVVEMMYQYDRDYFFDCSKFTKKFGFKPTRYAEGIKAVIDHDFS